MRPINFVQFRQITTPISAKIFSFLKPSLVFDRWFGFRRIVVVRSSKLCWVRAVYVNFRSGLFMRDDRFFYKIELSIMIKSKNKLNKLEENRLYLFNYINKMFNLCFH